MVALDVGGAGPTTRLDDIRIERALHEEVDGASRLPRGRDDVAGRVLEDPDELPADDLALLLGIAHVLECVEEALLGIDDDQPDTGGGHEVALDLRSLPRAEQTVIDEDAGELVADSPLHQGSRDRRVDTAGESADDLAIPDLRADTGNLIVDHALRGP